MEAVSATARPCVVNRRVQIVFAEKPLEDLVGFFQPATLLRQPVDLKTGRDRCACLQWLLIEARLLASFNKESVGPDRHEYLFVVAVLLGHKPLERIHSRLDHSLVIASPSSQDERLRQ